MIGFFKKLTRNRRLVWMGGALLILILGILIFSNGNGKFDGKVKVVRGTIIQSVAVTGKTQAISNVELSFDKSGRVANIPVKVGDRVRVGQVLASLESSEIRAQLQDALANVDIQKAKLQELLVGSRPEDIKIKESELQKDQQDLTNFYGGALIVLNDGYNKAEDAIKKQLDPLFNNDDEINSVLSFEVSNSQLKTNIESQRLALGLALKEFKDKLITSQGTSDFSKLDQILIFGEDYLRKLQFFLNDVFQAVSSAAALSASTAETYKGNIDTARTNVNTAISNVTDRMQDISAQRIVVQKAEFALELEKAGSTKEQIAAQEAQVKQAEAKVQIIQAQLNQNSIFAPFSGLIAKQDLEVGEVAAANKTFITLISDDKLEVEANVPEVSIGRVLAGNLAKITLDAFSDEVFEAKVVYVEPAETLVEGVVNYKVKLLFDKPDPRIRSGLTADIEIITLSRENVLKIPSYTLSESAEGKAMVQVIRGGRAEEAEIGVGIRGSDGSAEVVSGLSEGDEIVGSL